MPRSGSDVMPAQYHSADKCLRLPGGIVLFCSATSAGDWLVETSLVREVDDCDNGRTRLFKRLVVERVYGDDGELKKCKHWVDERRETQ